MDLDIGLIGIESVSFENKASIFQSPQDSSQNHILGQIIRNYLDHYLIVRFDDSNIMAVEDDIAYRFQ
jgi:hypothetical protein